MLNKTQKIYFKTPNLQKFSNTLTDKTGCFDVTKQGWERDNKPNKIIQDVICLIYHLQIMLIEPIGLHLIIKIMILIILIYSNSLTWWNYIKGKGKILYSHKEGQD